MLPRRLEGWILLCFCFSLSDRKPSVQLGRIRGIRPHAIEMHTPEWLFALRECSGGY